ncbi:MAG: hypothetical protein PHP97_01030 [Candidatus Shapirobacteria bacterium]|nr:hypothetical protein [Candidatus Shapirobacteria bacterium]MDD3003265.1 hypothetical protein [Candidatus Shapirobacteria bacterium]MDD4382615.1 hypothetical protein [Candidatus Shapirobacteria bacterium]
MAPIEGRFISPTLEENILAQNGKERHFNVNDLRVILKGYETGGDVSYKHVSQKNYRKIHVEPGEIIEKQVKVVAKGGVIEKIGMRFIGK